VRKRALENAVTGNAEGLDILHSEGIRCDDLHHRLLEFGRYIQKERQPHKVLMNKVVVSVTPELRD